MFATIAPSVTLNAADALLQILVNKSSVVQTLGSFYMIDSGAFFINYMVTIALLSNAIELLRIQDFVSRRWKKFKEATTREVALSGSNGASPFAYGIQVHFM